MCGIIGAWDMNENPYEETLAACHRLRHRGPDDSGVWLDGDSGVALGQTRLAIVDLSPAGRQPMFSSDDRFVIVLNGEIYNHLELRRILETQNLQLKWRGHSDTETLLACISGWGIEKTLQSVVGMFAFALWDRRDRVLFLARDRMGEKPLHYSLQHGTFFFSSELKALHAFKKFDGRIDRTSLARYMSFGYIRAPWAIYEGVSKLIPGTYLKVRPADLKNGALENPIPYWSAKDYIFNHEDREKSSIGEVEAVERLENLISNSVRGQMMSDVPLGAFLSGGIDSSTVVAFLQRASSKPVKTFTIGFHEESYDETIWARKVANFLGTDHTEHYVTPGEALEVIPNLPEIYDEPFADSSQIPTFLVSKLARQQVAVALSGDGGDELFGGYSRYHTACRRWDRVRRVPNFLRKRVGKLAPYIPNNLWKVITPVLKSTFLRSEPNITEDKVKKVFQFMIIKDRISFYKNVFLTHWNPHEIVLETTFSDNEEPPWVGSNAISFLEEMMAFDTLTYLPDDILVKVDRAAMAVSLETRVPLLDHRIFEFSWILPEKYKVRDNQVKWLLRQVLYRHIPKELVERPKMGFAVPIASWLRGPLRDWAGDLLNERGLSSHHFLNVGLLQRKFKEHLSMGRDWSNDLWDALIFLSWKQYSLD